MLREIEMEEKRRKWYFDQLEDAQKKLESLPVTDTVSFQHSFVPFPCCAQDWCSVVMF